MRPGFNSLRFLAFFFLILAATQPTSTCTEQAKARESDGSLSRHEVQRNRDLWEEISEQNKFWDTVLVVLCFAWPAPFLLFRRLNKVPRTRWPLGVAESAIGGLCGLTVWVMANSPCWTLGDPTDPHLQVGSYFHLAGSLLYLSAWPIQSVLNRRL